MEENRYYYKKLDEIYGLVYDSKLVIEMLKRTKDSISKDDVEKVKTHIIDTLNEITNYENAE